MEKWRIRKWDLNERRNFWIKQNETRRKEFWGMKMKMERKSTVEMKKF